MPAVLLSRSQDSLHTRGIIVSSALRTGGDTPPSLILRGRRLAYEASQVNGEGTVYEALALIDSELVRLAGDGDLAANSLYTFRVGVANYIEYLDARSVSALSSVSRPIAEAWIRARTPDAGGALAAPAVATMEQRRSVVRMAHRIGRQFCLCQGDPTLDIALPPRPSRNAKRPLTDDEILVARGFAEASCARTHFCWALAEAAATPGETGVVDPATAVDLVAAVVALPGNATVRPRTNGLTDFGRTLLEASPEALTKEWSRSGRSGQSTTSTLLARVLRRAGLSAPDVAPSSVRQWAGHRALEASGDICQAARILGTPSLDTAARLVGHDWLAEAQP